MLDRLRLRAELIRNLETTNKAAIAGEASTPAKGIMLQIDIWRIDAGLEPLPRFRR